ncbi:MAG: hypothetical protein JW903_02860 [Clostridia bacterium]|nr:hypothetical protein [Clostridia bacterium]
MDLSIFEAIMLLCFGLAWPFSIIRSIKSRSTKGKSLFFLFIIETGYISGTVHKLMFSTDLVMVLYILNGLMVLADIILYFINRRRETHEALRTY